MRRRLLFMAKRSEFIAQGYVMQPPERLRVSLMDDYLQRIVRYRIAMSMAKSMLNKGIITKEEYAKIDTIMTKNAELSLDTIFSEIP